MTTTKEQREAVVALTRRWWHRGEAMSDRSADVADYVTSGEARILWGDLAPIHALNAEDGHE